MSLCVSHKILQRCELAVCLAEQRFLVLPPSQRDKSALLVAFRQRISGSLTLSFENTFDLDRNISASHPDPNSDPRMAHPPLILLELVPLELQAGRQSQLDPWANESPLSAVTDSSIALSCLVTLLLCPLPITLRRRRRWL
jgi:hypothetical protein